MQNILKHSTVIIILAGLMLNLTADSGYFFSKKQLAANYGAESGDENSDENDNSESKKGNAEQDVFFYPKKYIADALTDQKLNTKLLHTLELIYKSIPKVQNTPPPEFMA